MELSKNPMYLALKARYKAKRLEALANMQIFMKAPVGVADHPDMLNTIAKFAEEIAHAEDILYSLGENFEKESPEEDSQS
jgi:hypothetical protein